MRVLMIAILCLGISAAFAGDVYNPGAASIGDYPDIDNPRSTGIVGALLLEDGTSIILLEDGTSNLCLEGGC